MADDGQCISLSDRETVRHFIRANPGNPWSNPPDMNRLLSLAAPAFALAAVTLTLLGAGCLNVKTDAIEVKPIHITVDVNVRVEQALDNFFGDLDQKSTTLVPHKS